MLKDKILVRTNIIFDKINILLKLNQVGIV